MATTSAGVPALQRVGAVGLPRLVVCLDELRAGNRCQRGDEGGRQHGRQRPFGVRRARPRGSNRLIERLDEGRDAVAGRLQVLQRVRVGNAQEARRVERFAGRRHHVRLADQAIGEFGGRAHAVRRQQFRDIDEQIERARRTLALDARIGRQPAEHRIAARAVFLEHFGDAFLRAAQRRDDRALRDRAGVRGLMASGARRRRRPLPSARSSSRSASRSSRRPSTPSR